MTPLLRGLADWEQQTLTEEGLTWDSRQLLQKWVWPWGQKARSSVVRGWVGWEESCCRKKQSREACQ